jgi:hypothetical protein
MGELTQRSVSQILRGYLPQQTQDLRGSIYRVKEWSGAPRVLVDDRVLRRNVTRQLRAFELAGNDGGVVADMRGGANLEVVSLDNDRGVLVERFPQVWICRTCRRIGRRRDQKCRCGSTNWGQLHFLGFHRCGAVAEPRIARCPTHDDVRLVSPRSTRARDIQFRCPECDTLTMQGLGFRPCPGCGQGNLIWNVHKSRQVFAPHGGVLVNPPHPEKLRELLAVDGATRALQWVLDGMQTAGPQQTGKPTRAAFVDNLVRSGIGQDFAEKMADQAEASGELQSSGNDQLADIPPIWREAAEFDAVEIAVAVGEARVRQSDIPDSQKHDGFEASYSTELRRLGLQAVDLVEQFPILNYMYGYTRGDASPQNARLVPFRAPSGGYRLHGELSETEALFFQLDPLRIAAWLASRGHTQFADIRDPETARIRVLETADIPDPGAPVPDTTVGLDVATLVHTFAHRVIRQLGVFAGIDRDALSEYLMPRHLGFFAYAAAHGDFVLGGLQAVYETDMDVFLRAIRRAERRCPLDPGCSRGSGACSACLHIGEPSCRSFNTMLDRDALFGSHGFWADHD